MFGFGERTERMLTVLLSIFVFIFNPLRAEDIQKRNDRTHHLGILAGVGTASYREDLLVPLGFSGPSFSLGGMYTRQTEQKYTQIRLRFSMGLLENRYSHKAYSAVIELQTSMVRKISENTGPGDIWAGISVPLQLTNLFLESWDDSHLYWLTTHSLAFVTEYRTRIPGIWNPIIRLDMPVIGFISRPPTYRYKKQEALTHLTYHFTEPNRSLHFEYIGTYQAPRLQVYFKRGSEGSVLRLGLDFQLIHCSEPEDIWGISCVLLFSYQWRIG